MQKILRDKPIALITNDRESIVESHEEGPREAEAKEKVIEAAVPVRVGTVVTMILLGDWQLRHK